MQCCCDCMNARAGCTTWQKVGRLTGQNSEVLTVLTNTACQQGSPVCHLPRGTNRAIRGLHDTRDLLG